jgi:hypothetical protein
MIYSLLPSALAAGGPVALARRVPRAVYQKMPAHLQALYRPAPLAEAKPRIVAGIGPVPRGFVTLGDLGPLAAKLAR